MSPQKTKSKVTTAPKEGQEAATLLKEKRVALRRLRFGGSGSKTTNVKAARGLRREIARLLTGLSARRPSPIA